MRECYYEMEKCWCDDTTNDEMVKQYNSEMVKWLCDARMNDEMVKLWNKYVKKFMIYSYLIGKTWCNKE